MTEPANLRQLNTRLAKIRARAKRHRDALAADRAEAAEVHQALENAVIEQLKTGRSVIDVANEAGLHRTRVNQIRKAHNLAPTEEADRG